VQPIEKQTEILCLLLEGLSIRATHRRTRAHRDTINRLSLRIGQACALLHDRLIRDVQVSQIQLDEQHSYVGKRQVHISPEDPEHLGETWLFIALAANEKAVLSYLIGKRTEYNARILARDPRSRILNRPQITTDGFVPSIDAVEDAFGGGVDFAQLVKNAGGSRRHQDRGPFIQKTIISGDPDLKKISTSFVERFNLSSRMSLRRLVRRTNAFSKRLEHHHAAMSLWIAYYNFCRFHSTLRTTPAVAVGVTDHICSVAELMSEALKIPPRPETPEPGLASAL
jgi:IS1 family transposase